MNDFAQQNHPGHDLGSLLPFAVPDLIRDLDHHLQEAPGQARGGEARHVG
jgi:hypothetical protein